jgi:ACS family hexuronate transporter-like MFS transporter
MNEKIGKYRWTICGLLFFATTINYLDRQVLSLTWKDYIVPEFHWTDSAYGDITSIFSLVYAFSMLFAGKFIDWIDTKKGFMYAIFFWSIGALLHAYCGIATSGVLKGTWFVSFETAKENLKTVTDISRVINTSVAFFIVARIILAIGESGNFPAAIKTTAEYFPKKDRGFATSVFNSGATVGAMLAPITIPFIADAMGWEMTFVVIGALGFLWMFFWHMMYNKPHLHRKVSETELVYIQQDDHDKTKEARAEEAGRKLSLFKAFQYKQTWAFAVGKFMTDGVWWFFLFWTPAYLKDVYGLSGTQAAPYLTVLYAITMLSLIGGWLPSYFIAKKGMNPYNGRMLSMLIFAFFPLLALLAQPLGSTSVWLPVIIIGIAGAAHQSWSANIFSTVSDMFPKYAVATITGIGGMAGGLGSYIINKGSGKLFDYANDTKMTFFGFTGKPAGYFIVFSICAVAYLIAWVIMKRLVPKYKVITDL